MKRIEYRLVTISTPRGTKRLQHKTLISALPGIAERYGWKLAVRGGQLAMVEAQGGSNASVHQ